MGTGDKSARVKGYHTNVESRINGDLPPLPNAYSWRGALTQGDFYFNTTVPSLQIKSCNAYIRGQNIVNVFLGIFRVYCFKHTVYYFLVLNDPVYAKA
jgi:hypothetical protein